MDGFFFGMENLWELQDGALSCLLLSGHPSTASPAQPEPGAPSGEQHGSGGLRGWEKQGSEVRRWLDVWTDGQTDGQRASSRRRRVQRAMGLYLMCQPG